MEIGRRTLLEAIQHLAEQSGGQIWARYTPSTAAFQSGDIRDITFSALAAAIDRLAWHLRAILPERQPGEVVCYVGPSDIRYFILICAAAKAELLALFCSPRNNKAAHDALLSQTGCKYLLTTADTPGVQMLLELSASRGMKDISMPSLDELLDKAPVPPIHFAANFDDVAQDALVIFHTSGSTGVPKPIRLTHGLLSTNDAAQLLPSIGGRSISARHWMNISVYSAFPPFHVAGTDFFLNSIFRGTQLIMGPPDAPPSLDTVRGMLELDLANGAALPPSLLIDISTDEQLLLMLKQWSCIMYGGGPLPDAAGDTLCKHTKLLQVMGSSETLALPSLETKADEWAYLCFHPHLNIEFRQATDTTHELVFVRSRDHLHVQGAFWTFSDAEEYSMRDLYEAHPTQPGLWKFSGRLDDIIVLSNGEKFNPVKAEQMLLESSSIKAGLIVGTARQQAAVLVEPRLAPGEDMMTIEAAITEQVHRTNSILPAHAQIHDSHIRILGPKTTFLRSAKGELRRNPTVKLLEKEIAEIYNAAEAGQSKGAIELDASSQSALGQSLADLISDNGYVDHRIDVHDDIFDAGFDSLKVVKLSRSVRASTNKQGIHLDLTARRVYQNPSAFAMSNALLSHDETSSDDSSAMQEILDGMIAKVSRLANGQAKEGASSDSITVLLTGSTGSLGSYVLDSLISNNNVDRVFCLNRSGSGLSKQQKMNLSRGLSSTFDKVKFMETDTSLPQLGLSNSDYQHLCGEVTHIVHNAWPVAFNFALNAFRPQLDTCYHLLELATAARHRVSISFASSISTANNWAQYHSADVPEISLHDFKLVESMGYA